MQEKKYNPACCEHKMPNGLSSFMFHSASSGSGPDMYYSVHESVCTLCGTIRIEGFRRDKDGHPNKFSEEFSIHAAEAIDAIIKYANYIHGESVWGRIEKKSAPVWVKASDRLPEQGKQVFATDISGRKTTGYFTRSNLASNFVDTFYSLVGCYYVKGIEYESLMWLDESREQKESDAEDRCSVFIPCPESDPEIAGAYTSNDGQSLCYVKEVLLPLSSFKAIIS